MIWQLAKRRLALFYQIPLLILGGVIVGLSIIVFSIIEAVDEATN